MIEPMSAVHSETVPRWTINDPRADFYLHQANELMLHGEQEKALAFYDKALSYQPDFGEVFHQKGNLLDQMGRFSEAITCYNSALECDPGNAEIWYNKGISLRKTGCDDESHECIHRSLSIAMGEL